MAMRISSWRHHYEGMSMSPREIYESIVEELEARDIPGLRIRKIVHREGGVFSAKREYLLVQRQEYRFNISAIPFAQGIIVSWYLDESLSLFWRIAFIFPTFGLILIRLFRPDTFSRFDRAWAFQAGVHSAILDAMAAHVQPKGLRALSEDEERPILLEFSGSAL